MSASAEVVNEEVLAELEEDFQPGVPAQVPESAAAESAVTQQVGGPVFGV